MLYGLSAIGQQPMVVDATLLTSRRPNLVGNSLATINHNLLQMIDMQVIKYGWQQVTALSNLG